MNILSLRNY